MKNKTWNEFWGEFLQVTFHKGHPELWPSRERKAKWATELLKIAPAAKILDLGCGDGMIDIWLSRMGYDVTAVDRNSKVLEYANAIDDTAKVTFINSDLMDVQFGPGSFDAVLFIESSGLMSKSNEAELFERIHQWLKPDGKILLDCPENVDKKASWSKEYPMGTVRGESGFNDESRIQDIQFYFKPVNKEEFGMYDPYDLSKGDVPGIMRYLYPKTEIIDVLKKTGFKAEEVKHYYEKNYFGILGTKLT